MRSRRPLPDAPTGPEARRARACPVPGALSTHSSPSSASTRSRRPRRPVPRSASAPPTPLSAISTSTRLVDALDAHPRRVRAGVLDDVGERLGDGVVRRRLDRLGQALGQADVERDRERRPGREHLERRLETALREDGRVDPLRELAQLGRSPARAPRELLEQRSASAGDVRSFDCATRSPSARATSRCCAPSWRLRSIRRRSVSLASTMRRRDADSSSRASRARDCQADELGERLQPVLGLERDGLVLPQRDDERTPGRTGNRDRHADAAPEAERPQLGSVRADELLVVDRAGAPVCSTSSAEPISSSFDVADLEAARSARRTCRRSSTFARPRSGAARRSAGRAGGRPPPSRSGTPRRAARCRRRASPHAAARPAPPRAAAAPPRRAAAR